MSWALSCLLALNAEWPLTVQSWSCFWFCCKCCLISLACQHLLKGTPHIQAPTETMLLISLSRSSEFPPAPSPWLSPTLSPIPLRALADATLLLCFPVPALCAQHAFPPHPSLLSSFPHSCPSFLGNLFPPSSIHPHQPRSLQP